jgi:hypothetical protein
MMTCICGIGAAPIDGEDRSLWMVRKQSYVLGQSHGYNAQMAANSSGIVETCCSGRGYYCLHLVEPAGFSIDRSLEKAALAARFSGEIVVFA